MIGLPDNQAPHLLFEEKNVDHIRDYVGGLALHLTFNLGSFTFIGEYVGATDEFHDGELDFKGRGARPRAWNIELAYTRDILGSETTFALGYQGTDEALALELPKDRYLAAIGTGLVENASITLEYLHDEDYSKSDGGTDDDANMVTFQLAVEF
nr:LbtU family siderophore porin [Desulfobacterales bacterium]